MLSVGSLFSGIGGIDLGLERAGMRVSWQVEIDDWCRRVLTRHWPDVPKHGDIREVGNLPYVDVLAGGFPCQPVSLAGKGLAQGDERWMWPEFERIIRLVRPRYVLIENTPGLLPRGFDDVLRSLAALGFDAEWQVLSAAAFGAPHLRRRLWVVAYPSGNGRGPRGPWRPVTGGTRQCKPDRSLDVAHTNSRGCDRRAELLWTSGRDEPANGGSAAANADGQRQLQPGRVFTNVRERPGNCGWWSTEPDVARMVHGVPGRVDRVRGLGNAVVPQIVEYIGRLIIDHAKQEAA